MPKILVLCLLVTFFVSGCYPGTWINEMTYEGPALYRATFSRDGRRIAFVYTQNTKKTKGIYITDLFGNSSKLLVEADIDIHMAPVFVPDDKEIIYYTKHGQFFKVSIDNPSTVPISNKFNPSGEGRNQITAVYLSRDSKVIKFQKIDYFPICPLSYKPSLFILESGKKKATAFSFPEKRYFENAWGHLSPDGLNVVFTYKNNLHVLSLKNKKVTKLTNLNNERLTPGIIKFTYSCDGKRIAYITTKGIHVIHMKNRVSKLVYDFQEKKILTDNIKFSPDGKYLLFNLTPRIFESPPASGFYRLDLKTEKLKMINKALVSYYVISPDCEHVLYRSSYEKNNNYHIITIHGKSKREVILRPPKEEENQKLKGEK